MMTLLQLINHVGNGFDVSRMEISALKTSLALESKKFEDKKLEALLEEDQSQERSNARGACRIIGDNSTSRFCLRAMGMIQKQGNWVPMN